MVVVVGAAGPAIRRAVRSGLAILVASCAAHDPAGYGTRESELAARIPSLHTVWELPSPPAYDNGKIGFYNIDSRVRISDDPAFVHPPLFWASNFFFSGGEGGGYLGLQDGAPRNDGSVGRIAIFSIWNATGATPGPSAWCVPFGGEGEGMSCRLAFEWRRNATYRLRVWASPPGAWRGSILDEETGTETVLGDILVPETWSWLSSALDNFTENFGHNGSLRYRRCSASPRVSAVFFAPTANTGSVSVIGAKPSINAGSNCRNVISNVAVDLSQSIQAMNPQR